MGIIKNLFNRGVSNQVLKLVTEQGNGFYSWNGKIYQSDLIRGIVRPTSKTVGKSIPKHIRNSKDGFSINPEPYLKILLEEPNPHMTMQSMLEKVTNQLELNNNAFILINRDENGYPNELYPISANGVEAIYDKSNELFLRFTLLNGNIITFSYDDIIHLRQDVNENDIFGESPIHSLKQLMEIVSTTDQGIIKAIRNSGVIKWLLKFNTPLRPEDLEKATKSFVDSFLNIDKNNGGAAATDSKYDAKQVDPKDYVPNAAQMDRTTLRLYSFFNTNEKIVQSKFNEDEWNSFYENKIEPILHQLSGEFTKKIFTKRERGFGNKIIFSSASLQYASMQTKMNLLQMVDRGAMTPNEWREIMSLPPIEGGDKPIRRLDTAEIKTDTGNNENSTEYLKGGEE